MDWKRTRILSHHIKRIVMQESAKTPPLARSFVRIQGDQVEIMVLEEVYPEINGIHYVLRVVVV